MGNTKDDGRQSCDVNMTSAQAQDAADFQKSMGVRQALKMYPKAVFFSVLMSFCVVMEGYDTMLTGNFFGLAAFNRKFGELVEGTDGEYQLTSAWQSGILNGAAVGQMIGLTVAGYCADRFGYVKTIQANLLLMTGFIFIFFFAERVEMIMAAAVLCGLPWGAFQSLTTTYAADVTPMAIRPILTTFVNMCWVIGQFISVGVLTGTHNIGNDWAWRIPYAVQWVFPPFIIVGMIFAPESPVWLIKQDRIEDARRTLRKLCNASDEVVGHHLAILVHADEVERQTEEKTGYLECFKGTNLRRTEATCGTWMIQVCCGVWFGSNIIYFLQRTGLSESASFYFGLGQQAVALCGTATAWIVMQKLGRRTIYLVGMATMLGLLLIIGFLGIAPSANALNWASGVMMILFFLAFQLSVGPVCYCIVTELPSSRLRVKTVALARTSYNITAFGANWLNPALLNPGSWNLRGKAGFVWGGINFIMLVWAYFRLPETKGRTAAEIDLSFEEKVPARKFAVVPALVRETPNEVYEIHFADVLKDKV